MRRTLASIGLMAVGLMIIGFAYFRAARTVAVEPLHPDVPWAEWQAYVTTLKASPPNSGPAMTTLMDAWRALNRAEAEAVRARRSPGDDPTYRAALAEFHTAVVAFDRLRGGLALAQLGRWEGLRLINAMHDLLTYARHRGSDVASLLREAPWPQPVQAYVDIGGGFAQFATAGGFVDNGAFVEARTPLMQAVFMNHWATLLRPARPIEAYRRADEMTWLHRWQLEFHRDGPLAPRLAAADALSALADYPAHLNAGVALFEAGRFKDAVARFRQSKARLAPVYERMARRRLDR